MMSTNIDNSYTGQVILLDARLSICTDRKPDMGMFKLQVDTLHKNNAWHARPKWMSAKFIAERYELAGLAIWDMYDAYIANFRLD